MALTSQERLSTAGHFTPTYVSLVARATLSKHNGTPILEAWNPVYHYWATHRDLHPYEVVKYLGPVYLRNMKAPFASHHTGVTEFENMRFTAEASDLGIRPGEWPTSLATDLGNLMPFVMTSRQVDDGDLQWVDYRQALGCISLRIFND